MIWAIKNNEKIKASPKQRAICQKCNNEVIAKCGEIKIWHWTHKKGFICDFFKEPESEWHIEWKELFPKEFQEVVTQSNQGLNRHRADIKTKNGIVIEFQNSPISNEDILKREKHYKNMIWILNGKTIAKNIIFYVKQFKWKWYSGFFDGSSLSIPIYIDKGNEFLYRLDDLDSNVGNFTKISKDAFIIQHGGKPKWVKTKVSMQTSLQ